MESLFSSLKKKKHYVVPQIFSNFIVTFSCEPENINVMIELIPITHAAKSKNLSKKKRKEVVF